MTQTQGSKQCKEQLQKIYKLPKRRKERKEEEKERRELHISHDWDFRQMHIFCIDGAVVTL